MELQACIEALKIATGRRPPSDMILGAGHTYSVRFNDEQRNPRIEEMLTEILAD